jgi:4-aminobutyrate---pyruvate transaminase
MSDRRIDSSLPNSLEARDKRSVVHGLTNLRRHLDRGPLVIESGNGVWVKDVDGKEYIEGMSGLWCVSLGYGQQRLVDACTRQMQKLPYGHLTNHYSHEPVIELAEKLLAIAPVPMSHVWFANSGSEGIDCAARLCWYYWNAIGQPERRKFIAHRQAYHGNTIASASLTGTSYAHEKFNLPLPGFLHVNAPDYFNNARDGESEEVFVERLIGDIERLLQSEGADTIAAFFVEPIMAAGGVIVPPNGYFGALQSLLDRHGILLVCDEVVTAFGRTGEMFGATAMSLRPDLLVCAKGLSSAYFPISAVMINEKIFEAMLAESDRQEVFGLTLTYSGHPVAAAVAREAIRIYEEEGIVERVRLLEESLLGGLRRRLAASPLVVDIRGRGLLAGVQLRHPDKTRDDRDRAGLGRAAAESARRNGLIVRAIGETLAICPPLIITAEEIAHLIERLATAVDEITASVGS